MPVCVLISELKEIGGAPRRLRKYSLLAAIRYVSKWVQRAPMHPRGSPPPSPRTSCSTMWSHRSDFSWDKYETSCRQLRYFEVYVAPTNTNSPSWGPLEHSGAPNWKQGALCDGAPGMMPLSRKKILATSMAMISEILVRQLKYDKSLGRILNGFLSLPPPHTHTTIPPSSIKGHYK